MTDENYVPQHSAQDRSRPLNPMFSNTTYDRLKFLAQVVLPAVGTLYFALSGFWGLPAAEQVVGTIIAVDTFLGVILGVSSTTYKDKTEGKMIGFMDIIDTEEGKTFSLNFPGDPMEIVNHDKVTFKVRSQ